MGIPFESYFNRVGSSTKSILELVNEYQPAVYQNHILSDGRSRYGNCRPRVAEASSSDPLPAPYFVTLRKFLDEVRTAIDVGVPSESPELTTAFRQRRWEDVGLALPMC